MFGQIADLISRIGIAGEPAALLARAGAAVLVLLLSYIAHLVVRGPVLTAIHTVIRRTASQWDDVLVDNRVFRTVAHVVPAVVIYILAPAALRGYGAVIAVVETAVVIYLIAVASRAVDLFLNAVVAIWDTSDASRDISIKSFVQFIKIIIYIAAAVFIVSVLLDKSLSYLLGGLTALTAVILFVFRDPILGLVAGIQLSTNRMVSRGDWIEMPKYGADGDVLEVALTTVKVQNWDKTITTIPTYALISESFKNWRGMQESGGRRIKRVIHIDVNSIRHCDEEMLGRYQRIRYVEDYLEKKQRELAEYNEAEGVDLSVLANGRRLTNVGTFRAYVVGYLWNHPKINREMTFLVRQLAPTDHGLPIEIYVFCSDVVWASYEGIQADIFDHLLATIPEFDLRVFQSPTGADFRLGGEDTPRGHWPWRRE